MHLSPMEMQQHEPIAERNDVERHSQDLDPTPHNSSSQSGPQQRDDHNTFDGSQPGGTQISIDQSVRVQQPNLDLNSEDSCKLVVQNIGDDKFTGMVQNNTRAMVLEASNQQCLSMDKGIQGNVNFGTSMMNQQSLGAGVSSEEQSLNTGIDCQQPTTSGNRQPGAKPKLDTQMPMGLSLHVIRSQLDRERAMQLDSLCFKLKKNEIDEVVFSKHFRSIVGDERKFLKMPLQKLQIKGGRNSQTPPGQFQSHPHSGRQMQAPSGQMLPDSNNDSSIVKSREVENFAPLQGLNQQQTKHFSQMSRSNHLGPPNQGMNAVNITGKFQLGGPTHLGSYNTLQHKQVHCPSSISQEQRVGVYSALNQVKHEPFDNSNEQCKNQFASPHGLPSGPRRPDNLGPGDFRDESFKIKSSRMGITPSSRPLNNHISSLISPFGSGNILKTTPQKKPEIGKRPMETPGSSPPSSKKQKVSGSLLDQTIEHLNDVTAVSGVNLREEEEQLFSSPKVDSRESEASRRVAQEEEERLILNKIPLQKKVVEAMAKYGLKNMGKDVERCLSLCVEERLRGLIFNLIRLSKGRAYAEKSQGTIVTSDVRQQILSINKKAREEWEKRQAETKKLQKLSDLEDSDGVNIDHKKDESRAKSTKTNKEEGGKMCATAANVAVRAATGAGDMLSRWKLMIEAKQKQEVGSNASFSCQPDKNVTSTREDEEGEKSDSPSAAALTTPASMETDEVAAPRRISVRDLLAVLEREPQMSKSELLYRLYNRVSDADAATTTTE